MNPPRSAPPPRPRPEERAVLFHLGAYMLIATWGFGGNDYYVREILAVWGAVGAALALLPLRSHESRARSDLRRLLWLIPLALFNLLVLVSSFTPNLRELRLNGESYYVRLSAPGWRPGSAVPALGWRPLWLLDGAYLSCFNLAWIVRRRRWLRRLLLLAAGNAVLLAVFGTVQKLAGAPGLYFGLMPVKQPYFFSSFVYHNHWGAFMVLMISASLGLVWHYAAHPRGRRDIFHSPLAGGLVALLFLAATTPLSGSRSCTVLTALILAGALVHWGRRFLARRRLHGESVAAPLAAAGAAAVLALAGIAYLAQDVIAVRMALTEQQFTDPAGQHGTLGRRILYRDTWRMAEERLWFGWGMASYPTVFRFYNTQTPGPIDHLPIYYADAHNDWFQSVAEHGLVGTAIMGAMGLVPLLSLRRALGGVLPGYLLSGCAIVLLYAWLEFPFGNTCVVFTWWLLFFCALRYAELRSQPRERVASEA